MSLLALEVEGLRCLQPTRLELHTHVNLITGANGAGKTSLLEALYLLGRGRSFRTRHTERLVAHDARGLTVFGRTDEPNFPTVGLGYDRQTGLKARVGGRDARSLAELSEAFPVQIVDPGIHRLVEEGPAYRRRWLDWGVFHVEPGFVHAWTEHARTLKQRNAALKRRADPSPWEPDLVRHGTLLSMARARTMDLLEPYWRQTLTALLGEPVSLSYYRGWSQEKTLAQTLAAQRARDLKGAAQGREPIASMYGSAWRGAARAKCSPGGSKNCWVRPWPWRWPGWREAEADARRPCFWMIPRRNSIGSTRTLWSRNQDSAGPVGGHGPAR